LNSLHPSGAGSRRLPEERELKNVLSSRLNLAVEQLRST